jgi:hypothetical protein
MLGNQPGDGSPRKVAKVRFSGRPEHFLSPERSRGAINLSSPQLGYYKIIQLEEEQIREERFGSFVTVLMPKRREFEEVQIPTSAMTPPKQQTTAMSESVIASFYSSANQSQMDSYAKFVQQAAELQAAQQTIQELQLSLQIAQQTNPSLSLLVIP